MGQLKYNIRERLDKLTRKEHEMIMRRLLEAIQPASRSTFYRWINTEAEAAFQIPYTKQLKIAALLGCTIDELMTTA
ncbi:hypothetical protein [Taibaiella helva]|uniref:hypothetical protein n=1 Tax=Taibaiella helva TaxID=2301235 RepID=UPI0013005F4A|nr:hypothetical protein [Taibaiella helva]